MKLDTLGSIHGGKEKARQFLKLQNWAFVPDALNI